MRASTEEGREEDPRVSKTLLVLLYIIRTLLSLASCFEFPIVRRGLNTQDQWIATLESYQVYNCCGNNKH